jgi:hypothetical protein
MSRHRPKARSGPRRESSPTRDGMAERALGELHHILETAEATSFV